ncbi:alpha/beta hydrolase family protein [Phenylobacterium sp.]|uniref:alpha/beta hydrolase family protein n=1 Tax=Phenylobacterium sp. TaxID=1871053 RepID=UPI003561B74C
MALAAGAARAAPLEAYGKLAAVEDIAISPDGSRLALIQTDGEKRSIRVENLAQHRLERLLQGGDAKLSGMLWVGPDHLFVSRGSRAGLQGTEATRSEFQLGFDYNILTGGTHELLQDTTASFNAFWGGQTRVIGGKPVLFLRTYHLSGFYLVHTIYRIDMDTDKSTAVEVGAPGAMGLVLAADGHAIAESTWDRSSRTWALKFRSDDAWKDVRTEKMERHEKAWKDEFYKVPVLLGLGRDGNSVLVSETRGDEQLLREVNGKGEWSELLPIEGSERPVFDPAHHNLIGIAGLVGDEQRYRFFSDADQQAWKLVEHAYPNQRVRLVSWTDDRRKIVVSVDSPDLGPGYALIDLNSRHADWIANRYDKVGPADISPVRPIQFKAADGMQLTGYLATPRGAGEKNLPLIVFPHDGPEQRDEPGFDWWAQAMASRGYAVLQVNFRGSAGFGSKFRDAGFGQWGRKMQTDLSDGVRYLAKEGIVDPKRVCIVGASFGGYTAMAGLTLDPDVYRCAVSYGGISDMEDFTPWVRERDGREPEHSLMEFIGAKEGRDASVAEISPIDHIDRIKGPLLLIHGKDDTVVPIAQSRLMANAMKRAGKPVEYVTLDSTDHWLTRGDTRLQMLKATVDFLEKNNPPN